MRVLLYALLAGVPFFAVGLGVGMWFVSRSVKTPLPSDRELAFRERMAALDHHTEMLERSRKAALAGEDGLANIYAEAAERVLRLIERPDV